VKMLGRIPWCMVTWPSGNTTSTPPLTNCSIFPLQQFTKKSIELAGFFSQLRQNLLKVFFMMKRRSSRIHLSRDSSYHYRRVGTYSPSPHGRIPPSPLPPPRRPEEGGGGSQNAVYRTEREKKTSP
jgi:hypothetical protein